MTGGGESSSSTASTSSSFKQSPRELISHAGAGAAAGAIATTCMCPLDVIKTRLQVHGLPPNSGQGAPSDRDVDLIGSDGTFIYYEHSLYGYFSLGISWDAWVPSILRICRVDLGTSDFFAIDVLLSCLTVLSSEYLGIQQVVFGGRKISDWEEGMTSPEFEYKYFKI